MSERRTVELARRTGEHLLSHGWVVATAESCTGGGIGAAITAVPGSSAWFDRGFVTYSNAAKQQMLGVQAATLERHGAVSRETAMEMALGALAYSAADLSVAVTGIAGPDGGTADKPVGTVWIAWASRTGAIRAVQCRFSGDRDAVRQQTVLAALEGLLDET